MATRAPVAPLTDYLYQKSSREKIPLSGTFELSPVCNFACKMCYVRKTQAEVSASARKMLSAEDWLKIAEEARKAGMLFLLLTGGEPLLWPGFRELYKRLIEMGFVIQINSNGSLVDEEMAEFFRKYPPQRLNITLYGASDESYEALCGAKGMYARVKRGIELLRKAGVLVKLNCSLTPYNEKDLEAMVAYATAHKLVLQATSYMFPPLRRDERAVGRNERFSPEETAYQRLRIHRVQSTAAQHERYLRDILAGHSAAEAPDEQCVDPIDGRIRCRAGNASFWITWDGWLTPCGIMPAPLVDLKEKAFTDAWQELNGICENIRLSGKCARCPDADACHACAAMAYTETGSFAETPVFLCRVNAALRRMAEEELRKL